MKHTHLDSLKIRGFRGLSSLDLDGLGEFNILLGANDVGKTSILEAIFLLSSPANLQLPLGIQTWRNYSIREFDDLSTLFHQLDFDVQITLEAHCRDSKKRTLAISAPYENFQMETSSNGDAVKIQSDRQPSTQSSSSILFGRRDLYYEAKIKGPERRGPISFNGKLTARANNIELTNMPDAFADEVIAARYIGAGSQYDSDIIGEVTVDKKTDDLLKYLRIINPRVEGIARNKDKVYLDIGLKRMMPLNMFGSGMVRAAIMLSQSILRADQVLLIDEIENGLHYQAVPPLLKALLKFSREQQLQIFATTHSREILEALKDVLNLPEFSDYRQTTKCYALQRDKNGLVRSYKYDYSQYEHNIEHGIEIR